MGKAFDSLAECAEIIDDTKSWQVVHGRGHFDDDNFELSVVSRGPVPRLDDKVFGDLTDSVSVEVNPDDTSYTTVHFVKYIGSLAGMQLFSNTLAQDLDRGSESEVDVVSDFVSRNPFWGLDII